jgi:hypothetical protein
MSEVKVSVLTNQNTGWWEVLWWWHFFDTCLKLQTTEVIPAAKGITQILFSPLNSLDWCISVKDKEVVIVILIKSVNFIDHDSM